MATVCTIGLLGGISIQHVGEKPIRLSVTNPSLVLARLALSINSDVSKESLIEMLWPEADIECGRHNISQALLAVRHKIELHGVAHGSMLEVDHGCARLNPDLCTTDLHIFRNAVDEALRCSDAHEHLDLLRRAVGLYGGELAPGSYNDWILSERDHASASFISLLRRLIAALAKTGLTEEALEHGLKSVTVSPDSEELHEEVVRLYLDLDRIDEAVLHFEEYRARLWVEYEGVPGRAGCGSLLSPFWPHRTATHAIPAREQNERAVSNPGNWTRLAYDTAGISMLSRFFGREQEIVFILNRLAPPATGRSDLPGPSPTRSG